MADYNFSETKIHVIRYRKGMTVPPVQRQVVERLLSRNWHIAFAESLTGGLAAKTITEVPGASAVFECGVCSYSNRIKHQVLGVRQETLEQWTEYSPQTAAEMALGIRRLSDAEVCVATTGLAGPGGGTEDRPVGLVYVGILVEDELTILKLLPDGDCGSREDIRAFTVQSALCEVLDRLR